MGLLLFGFMWLKKPSEAELAERQRLQDSIAAVQKVDQQRITAEGNVDTLTTGEIAHLKSVLEAMPAENAAINNEGVMLSLHDGQITGTVKVGDKTLDWAEVTSSTSDDPAAHNLAVQAVQQALDVYAKNGSFAASLTGTEEIVTLENDSLKVEISTKGGMITRATLKGYKTWKTPQVVLFDKGDNDYSFALTNNTQRFETKNFFFTPNKLNDSVVVMNRELEGGAQWGLRYTLYHDSYMVRMEMIQQGMSSVIPLNITTVDLDWHQKISRHEEGKMFEERNSGIYYKYSGKDRLHVDSELSDTVIDDHRLNYHRGVTEYFHICSRNQLQDPYE